MFSAADELRLITRQMRALVAFRRKLEVLMADTDAALAELVSAVDGVASRVQEDVDALLAQIEALKSTSAEDKAALTAAAEGIRGQVSRLQGIDPVKPEPAPDPAPPTEPPAEPAP